MLTIVNEPSKGVQQNIGMQILRYGTKYKKSPYLKEVKIDDGLLVYNVLTSEIMLIDEGIYNCPSNELKNNLIKHWYYLEENVNPMSIADMFKQAVTNKQFYNKNNQSNSYVIMTTSVCNARCFYCYECGLQQRPMTDDIAKNVAKYLVQNNKQRLHLTWFGGEPLCNPNVIRIISSHLKKYGVVFNSSMISNGYLLGDFSIDEIKNDWKLGNIQITIDGTKNVYQTVKNYRNNDENAYEKIFDNIRNLLENDIGVSIRINVGLHNGDDVLDLIQELADNFKEYKKFKVYASPLFIGEGDPPLMLTNDEADKLYSNVKNACIKLKNLGFKQRNFNINIEDYSPFHCMADSGGAKMITIDGNLTPCEHHVDTEICGNIYDGVTNLDLLETWKERLYVPECKSCFNYPKCVKITKCSTDNICEKPQRMLMDYYIETRMIEIYEEYKDNHNCNHCNNCK